MWDLAWTNNVFPAPFRLAWQGRCLQHPLPAHLGKRRAWWGSCAACSREVHLLRLLLRKLQRQRATVQHRQGESLKLKGAVLTNSVDQPGHSVLLSPEASFWLHRLPEELNRCRRTAALRSLPLLFKLLGGDGITWKGVHRPIINKVRRI